MLEQFLKYGSLWEGPTLEQFMKDCIPHAGAGEDCEEEGVAETKHYELSATSIPKTLHCLQVGGGGRRVRNEGLKLSLG